MIRALCVAAAVCGVASGLAGAAVAQDLGTANFYLSINALALSRSTPEGGAIVASNPGGVPFQSASGLDFDMAPGIDAAIGFNVFDNDALEARLMHAKFEGDDYLVSPGGFIGYGFTGPGGTSFASDFSTGFTSGELNWRHNYTEQLSVLAGLRALDIDDRLAGVLNSGVATGVYQGQNRLLGAQIGAQMSLLDEANPFQLSLSGKIGAYSNRSSAGIKEYQGVNFIGSFESGNRTKTSIVAEIGVTAEYELTPSMALTAGYEAIWANNLALASNAASASILNPSLLRNTIYRDDLWMHGVTLGVRMTF